MSENKPLALVTGASSGIGLELARLFAADGYDLVLLARSRQRLDRLAEDLAGRHAVSCRVMVKDLSEASAPREIFSELRDAGLELTALVNNAGFGDLEDFSRMSETRLLEMMQVNMAALTHLTWLFLPPMLERGSGRILNVASTAAFLPGPGMAVYYASKAYVLSFSEALSKELEGSGVTLTCLCPGPVASGFQATANMSGSRFLKFARLVDPAPVARAGYRAMCKGKAIEIPGIQNRIAAQLPRVASRAVLRSVVRYVQGKA